ncbi:MULTISPECIES: AsmA-like C-terminal region-containing protein [unclassified Rhizobium]|uniref:AsmA-like C-terminal region-containing protein n=1 Tax=unclassified Rhizobium TaxID=2613769 RepID=UPI001ADCCBA5|nr:MULTISPECIES: AsmA-like C-terminal region-containing protein [unclassified Rhizobium]MBO9098527.1 hypothetical protein [Rhizobium sp. L58/93]MBO9132667.1 hypothetical protein [Rhizobium sp. B209b/85]MBO9184743.1 hypothetical protein [Rhizobium sp. E27B/91]QXZ84922.1 hypothetical protein J5287_05115 [Rhizobium sp. K1/93]QXZ90939.1 hypothetical protein J5280_04885 [Rhizobium sp. K15/93]
MREGRGGLIRGEKLKFRKKDLVPLDQMPSSQVDDPIIVNSPRRRRRRRGHVWHATRITGVFAIFIALIAGAVIASIESGIFDEPLSVKAQAALDNAIGPRYKAEVGSTVLRFTSDMQLALEASDVNVVDQETGKHLSTMGAVRMVLDPFALVQGRIAIATVRAKGIALDTALLPQSEPIDVANLRVDSIPTALESAFSNLDFLQHFVERGGTDAVEISGLAVKLARQDGGTPISLVIDQLAFSRPTPNTLRLKGQLSIDGSVASLDVNATQEADRPSSMTAVIRHLDLVPLSMAYDSNGTPRQGITGFADVSLSSTRGASGVDPKLTAAIKVLPGTLFMDRDAQEISGADINLSYNSDRQALEINKSLATFQSTVVPFFGSVIDLDRVDPTAAKGFGVDFRIANATAATSEAGEAPLSFDGHANGRYMTADKELKLDTIGITTPMGSLFGSLRLRIAPGSPEISFGAQAEQLQAAAVKQLWPFWMSPKARTWVQGNLFGGAMSNATISLFIPGGRLAQAAATGNLRLDENEIHLAFDINGSRLNVPGDIPPIRDMTGHFDLKGPVISVDIVKGTSYFPSGRQVAVGPSTFSIPAVYDKPLTAKMKLALSGNGDAVGELLTFKPLSVLQRTEFKPEDFSGKIDADVEATLGLINDQDPPPPVWKASLQLHKVDVLKAFDGRKITNVDGTIDADPQEVHLAADALIDGIPAQIDMVEPTEKGSSIKRERVVDVTLSNQQRETILPGLSDFVDGPLKVKVTRIDENRQDIKIDLTKAALTVPWIGWSKGSGIAANAEFEASGPADQPSLKNFTLKGDGFGATGSIQIGKSGLSSADFSSIKLSSVDDFALSIKRTKGAYDVRVDGNAADIRPILARLKAPSKGDDGGSDKTDATIRAKLDKIIGFNDETIRNVSLVYALNNGKATQADFSGVTRTGQAVVTEMTKGGQGGTFHVTSSDAGSVARFVDVYGHLRGGLLNLNLRADGDDSWDGSIDIRRFSIVNEKKLQSIVTTPAGRDGESLNSAVKHDIDTSAQNFQRGFAHLSIRKGVVSVENGVVRGDQVGATFQGTIKDAKGNTDMTGTFMPAYGLNRLFAEVPIVGFLLGNGTDRGLIGITFKLTGPFDSPNLVINPLSVIAPGIFRQIFEF